MKYQCKLQNYHSFKVFPLLIVLRQKSLYFDCHSGLDPESSVFPLGQVPPQRGFYPGGRPFWAGGNLDSRLRGSDSRLVFFSTLLDPD